MTTTLSLKLPPEVAKVMPWIVAARKSGDPKQLAWAKREYEAAQEKARWREQYERRAEERRLRFEYEQRVREEEQEREFLAWKQEQDEQKARLARLGVHFALEDGWEEIQPTQSSQKGWRRLLSELKDARLPPPDWRAHSWGRYWRQGKRDKKRNRGQKPRSFRDF